MDNLFIIIPLIVACIVSGFLYRALKSGVVSIAISIAAPILLLVAYGLSKRDEFGFFTITLSLGTISCLIGSILGIFISAQFRK